MQFQPQSILKEAVRVGLHMPPHFLSSLPQI